MSKPHHTKQTIYVAKHEWESKLRGRMYLFNNYCRLKYFILHGATLANLVISPFVWFTQSKYLEGRWKLLTRDFLCSAKMLNKHSPNQSIKHLPSWLFSGLEINDPLSVSLHAVLPVHSFNITFRSLSLKMKVISKMLNSTTEDLYLQYELDSWNN